MANLAAWKQWGGEVGGNSGRMGFGERALRQAGIGALTMTARNMAMIASLTPVDRPDRPALESLSQWDMLWA